MSDHKMDTAIQLYQIQAELLLDRGIDVKGRVFTLIGPIDESAFARVDACLTLLENDSRKGITIRLNSEGGHLSDAMAIISRIRSSSCKVTIEGHGLVASAALNILAAGHRRVISPICQVMHHEASGGVDPEARLSQTLAAVEQARREEQIRADLMGKFTKADADFWLNEGVGVDRYFTPEELIDLGVVDEILEV